MNAKVSMTLTSSRKSSGRRAKTPKRGSGKREKTKVLRGSRGRRGGANADHGRHRNAERAAAGDEMLLPQIRGR